MSIKEPEFAFPDPPIDVTTAFMPDSVEGRLAALEARVHGLEVTTDLIFEALHDLGKGMAK